MTRDVFDTFATHSGLVYDVTDTVLNKKGHCRVLATFKTSIKKKKRTKNRVKNCFLYLKNPFLSRRPVMFLQLGSPLTGLVHGWCTVRLYCECVCEQT